MNILRPVRDLEGEQNPFPGRMSIAARLIRGAGIKLVTANIVAIPGGSLATDLESLELSSAGRGEGTSGWRLRRPFPPFSRPERRQGGRP